MEKLDGMDMFLDMQKKTKLLDTALNLLGTRGREYARANQEYKVELAKEMLKQRENGVPVSIISDICRGTERIALLRMKRDVAEVVYKSAMEAIQVYKLEINLLREQIDREWHRG